MKCTTTEQTESGVSPNGQMPMSVFSVPIQTSVPPGLEDLTTLDSVFVKQQIELLESE